MKDLGSAKNANALLSMTLYELVIILDYMMLDL
jgi:hypothetical protein